MACSAWTNLYTEDGWMCYSTYRRRRAVCYFLGLFSAAPLSAAAISTKFLMEQTPVEMKGAHSVLNP